MKSLNRTVREGKAAKIAKKSQDGEQQQIPPRSPAAANGSEDNGRWE